MNRRVSKTVNGTTTYFVYDNDSVVAEYDGSGALQAEYVLGDNIDEVLAMSRNSTDYYYHYDGLGSVTEIADSAGAIQERYEYNVYGAPKMFDSTGTQIANSLIGNPYMFTGRRYDDENEIYYYRARNYDPTIGRFMQRDPLGNVESENLYQYVLNNPINNIDPMGEQSVGPWVITGKRPGNVSLGAGRPNPEGCYEGGRSQYYYTAQIRVYRVNLLHNASVGRGNFGLGTATQAEASYIGRAWVGKGYRVASDGKTFISSDGLRQYRPPSYKTKSGKYQANLESRDIPRGKWLNNGHLDIINSYDLRLIE